MLDQNALVTCLYVQLLILIKHLYQTDSHIMISFLKNNYLLRINDNYQII